MWLFSLKIQFKHQIKLSMNIEMKNLLNVSNHQLVCFKQITFKCLFYLQSILSFNPSESCHVFSQDWDVGHCFLVLFESDDILDPCLDRPKDIWITFGKGKIVFSFVWTRWHSRSTSWTSRRTRRHPDEVWVGTLLRGWELREAARCRCRSGTWAERPCLSGMKKIGN